MDTMTAAEAKQKFGQLLEKAQRGPVEITKHGRRVGIMYSSEDYEREQATKEKWLNERLEHASEQIESGEFQDSAEVFEALRADRKNRK